MENTLPVKPAAKVRDPLFDNIKAILIFLVVLGHLLVSFKGRSDALQYIYHCIYMFHIPLFVLVTGYLAKKSVKKMSTAIWYSLVPFLIFAGLFALVRYLVLPSMRDQFHWYNLPFAYWYLLGVFVWRFLTKPLAKLKGFALPLLLVAGLLIGAVFPFTRFLAVGRIVSFFPFYWLGFMLDSDTVAKIRKLPWYVGLGGMAAVFAAFWFVRPHIGFDISGVLQMDDEWITVGLGRVEFVLVRLAVYAIAALLCLCVIIAAPGKKTFFTSIGSNTISIYILHTYVVYLLVRKLHLFDGFFNILSPLAAFGVCLLFAGVMCALFGLPFFTAGYNKLTLAVGGALERAFCKKPEKAEKPSAK